MIRTIVLTTIAAVSGIDASSLAQERPNLSGEWKLIAPAATAAVARSPSDPTAQPATVTGSASTNRRAGRTGGGFECYDSCTIAQTDTTLTMQFPAAAPTLADIVLNLDGVETRNARSEPSNRQPVYSMIKAQWEGSKLLVTRTLEAGIAKLDQVISLEAGELTVVTRTHVQGTNYGSEGPKPVVRRYQKQ